MSINVLNVLRLPDRPPEFEVLHGAIIAACERDGGPLTTAVGKTAVTIDALPADPNRDRQAEIRVAEQTGRFAVYTSVKQLSPERSPSVYKGAHGNLVRDPWDKAPLLDYLASRTGPGTVRGRGGRLVYRRVAEYAVSAGAELPTKLA